MPGQIEPVGLTKALTGISGFDEITGGGLPSGRTSLILGSPGAGKTIFALESLVNAARTSGERESSSPSKRIRDRSSRMRPLLAGTSRPWSARNSSSWTPSSPQQL